MTTRFCPNCGTQLNADARFCHGCGAAITEPDPMPEPPLIPDPMPEPVSYVPPVPVKPKRLRCTPGIAILCILISICTLLTISLLTVRAITSRDTLQNSMEYMLVEVDLTMVPASDMINNAEPGQSMAEYIAQEIENSYVVPIQVDAEDVQAFLEDSDFVPFFAQEISQYVDDIRNDRRGDGITEKKLSNLLWDNKTEIEKLTGIPLTQTDVDNVVAKMDQKGLMRDLRAKTLKSASPEGYAAAQVALSDVTIIVAVAVIVALAVFVAMGYGWNILRACGSVGMALLVGGGIFLILGLSGLGMTLVWNSLISYVVSAVLSGGITCAVVTVILGAILVAADRIARK